jgi:hypothetical protein
MSINHLWFAVSTPPKNISQLKMILPNMWKNKIYDPNHQAV